MGVFITILSQNGARCLRDLQLRHRKEKAEKSICEQEG